MKIPSLLEMLQSGAHFGHQVSRWHPKMKPYIYTERNDVHIINLEETQRALSQVLASVKTMASEGKIILFVTTKPQAREIVRAAALDCEMPYLVNRWLGGMLTNFPEVKKLIKKYVTQKEQQASGELERYTKKEQLTIAKDLERRDKTLLGLSNVTKMPDALFIPSVQREKTAVTEAQQTGVPIIGVCDTNANPDKVEYVIPANDDAIHAIEMMVRLVAGAIKEGRVEWKKKQAESMTVASTPVPRKQIVREEISKPERITDGAV